MNTRTKLIGRAAAALTVGIAGYAFTASSQEAGPVFPFMRHTMMGRGMMGPAMAGPMMGMSHDSATMAQLRTIHELFTNHDRIKRTVTNLADGIRTETTSDDPKVIEWIKAHVADMGRRISAGNDPGLPIESDALHALFRNKDKIHTSVETIANGVIVIQTSSDPATVTALQQHAAEVTQFVKEGISAVHAAMMGNAGSGMHSRIMGPMMLGRSHMHGPMPPVGLHDRH